MAGDVVASSRRKLSALWTSSYERPSRLRLRVCDAATALSLLGCILVSDASPVHKNRYTYLYQNSICVGQHHHDSDHFYHDRPEYNVDNCPRHVRQTMNDWGCPLLCCVGPGVAKVSFFRILIFLSWRRLRSLFYYGGKLEGTGFHRSHRPDIRPFCQRHPV